MSKNPIQVGSDDFPVSVDHPYVDGVEEDITVETEEIYDDQSESDALFEKFPPNLPSSFKKELDHEGIRDGFRMELLRIKELTK